MARVPSSVQQFLGFKHIAVAGVSRDGKQPANAIYRKLRDTGHAVTPVNPRAESVEGVRCYPNLTAVPDQIEGVLIAAPPAAALDLVRECGRRGVKRVWFHRSVGAGSVSPEAVAEAEKLGLQPIVGGCPMMYCEPVDPAHRCMGAILRWTGRIPRH